ncbi:MAG: aldehyde dehydrogenase family protein [Bacteroidota bacterium]
MDREWKFFIDGEWRSSSRHRPVVNPYTRETIGTVAQASAKDILDAFTAAHRAFENTKKLQGYERSAILMEIANALRNRKEELARLITDESGKPIRFSRAEIDRSIFTFIIASEEAKRIYGETLPLDLTPQSNQRLGILRRFPIGVIAAITPFNFPINLVAHKVAPCIAAGNTVLLKPASSTAAAASAFTEIIAESSLPNGAFNLVTCPGAEAEVLATEPRIAMLTFTGSPEIGWRLKEKAWKKKVTLELGGNAGIIIDEKIALDPIIPRIVQGSFGNAGQSCIAVQRIFVHRSLFEEFREKFVMATQKVVSGDPTNDSTVVGTMIDEAAAIKTEEWIKEAVNLGAKVLIGGTREDAVFAPTVLVQTTNAMKVECREVFAPVVTLTSVDSFNEALRKLNDSQYGLQAGIFTNDLYNAFMAYEVLEVGGVMINDYPTYRVDHMPYGGVKESGMGREGVRYAIEEMTEPKLMVLNLSKSF